MKHIVVLFMEMYRPRNRGHTVYLKKAIGSNHSIDANQLSLELAPCFLTRHHPHLESYNQANKTRLVLNLSNLPMYIYRLYRFQEGAFTPADGADILLTDDDVSRPPVSLRPLYTIVGGRRE